MRLDEICRALEELAPLQYQESYDNSGLQAGNPEMPVTGALVCIDITPEIINEAENKGLNLIVSHHPLIFQPLKSINANSATGKMLYTAIHRNIALYAAHTNLDAISEGVNKKIADKIGLEDLRILSPAKGKLCKIATFVPHAQADQVRQAMFDSGAGHIGNYDHCSYNLSGQGTFRANESANPFTGQIGKSHTEEEIRIETIVPLHARTRVIAAMKAAHPYEEVAFDVYPLDNEHPQAGSGMIGNLHEPMQETDFLLEIKHRFGCGCVRHSRLRGKPIQRVALCGGSGSFLIREALRAGADIFVTGDLKYHQYFDTDSRMILADIGHYESEQFTKELIGDYLTKNFPTFAVHLSNVNTNPINYL